MKPRLLIVVFRIAHLRSTGQGDVFLLESSAPSPLSQPGDACLDQLRAASRRRLLELGAAIFQVVGLCYSMDGGQRVASSEVPCPSRRDLEPQAW